jgi:hypothetical protein
MGRPRKDRDGGISMMEVRFDEEENPHVEMKTNPREDNFNKIMELIEDPNTPLTQINRLIALEIAAANKEISNITANPMLSNVTLRSVVEQVKGLRELSKTLQDNEALSKKDIINFDGPKFQYVLTEIVSMFRKSIIKSGYSEETANDILRNYKDMMSVREADLRREVEKIDLSH